MLTKFVRLSAHVTFGGSDGIMYCQTGVALYPCISQAKSRDETSRRGRENDVTVCSYMVDATC